MSNSPLMQLGDFCAIDSGFPFKSDQFSTKPNDVFLLKGSNLGHKNISWNEGPWWDISDYEKLKRYQLHEGDVVLAMDRPIVNGSLKYAWVNKNNPKALLVQRVARLRSHNEGDQTFLRYVIASPAFLQYIDTITTGVSIPHISGSDIGKYEFHLPDMGVRNKIAAILSAYDDLIENNLQRIKLLEEMAQITYEEWFVRMKFPGHETAQWNKATGLPEGWRIIKTGDVFKTSSGGTPSRKNPEYFGEGVKWIRTQELNDGLILDANESITELGLKNSSAKVFPKNTVLLAMYGNTIGETGYLTFESATNQACCAFLTDEFSSYYLHQYLKINKQQVLNLRMGAAQENISQDIIKKMPILLPSEDVIQLFGRTASALYKSMESILKQNELLREAREILLPRLMTGVIDVDQVEVPEALLARVV